jgi:hypothetical protein
VLDANGQQQVAAASLALSTLACRVGKPNLAVAACWCSPVPIVRHSIRTSCCPFVMSMAKSRLTASSSTAALHRPASCRVVLCHAVLCASIHQSGCLTPCCVMLCHAVSCYVSRHPLWRDLEIVDDPTATPRQKIAARLTKIEKSILQGCLDEVTTCAPCLGGCTAMAWLMQQHAPCWGRWLALASWTKHRAVQACVCCMGVRLVRERRGCRVVVSVGWACVLTSLWIVCAAVSCADAKNVPKPALAVKFSQ